MMMVFVFVASIASSQSSGDITCGKDVGPSASAIGGINSVDVVINPCTPSANRGNNSSPSMGRPDIGEPSMGRPDGKGKVKMTRPAGVHDAKLTKKKKVSLYQKHLDRTFERMERMRSGARD